MKKKKNKKTKILGLTKRQFVFLPFIILIIFMFCIFINEMVKWNKKETLTCTGIEYNHNVKMTYNYIGGYFDNGNMRLIVDNNTGNNNEENVDWCEVIKEQYKETYTVDSCIITDDNGIITASADIVLNKGLKKTKLKDDKTMLENSYMNCIVE